MNNTCLIYNYAQHYRKGVFESLDKNLDIDFYFGDKMDDVKKMDYSSLKGFRREVANIILFKPIYFQKSVIKLLFKDYKNYILLGEYYCLSTWLLLLFSRFFFQKKTYLWTHGWYGNEGLLKKIIKKIFFKLSDGIFLYGNYAKDLMIKEGFNPNKLHVINNSLDWESQISVRANLKYTKLFSEKFGNDNPTLLFIGRLTPVKKLDFLIEAVTQINAKKNIVNLVFVGDGTEAKKLKQLSKKIEKSAWFYGSCYDENKIGELIYNADLCISPGNVGLTAMHSMVYGTPVITNDNFSTQMPEFEAIVKNETGDFFKVNDIQDLAFKIKLWLNNGQKREDIRRNCYDRIDKYYTPIYQTTVIKEVIEL